MSEIFFVIKVLVITFVLVLFLQVKVGDHTLDQRIHHSLQESTILAPLQEVAKGGVMMIEQTYRKLVSQFDRKLSDKIEQTNAPGNRSIMPELKRMTKESAEKVEKSTKETAKKFHDRLFSEEDY